MVTPSAREVRLPSGNPVLAALSFRQFVQGAPRVAVPRPEVQVIARLGGLAKNGADVHILGPRDSVHRKFIQGGQRVIVARLQLGASAGVLGVAAGEVAGRLVPLDEVWGAAASHALCERMANAREMPDAAKVLHKAICMANRDLCGSRNGLAVEAAKRLPDSRVHDVATDLGVSERHLRRVFRGELGVSPKTFTRLARFRRAIRVARERREDDWAAIAADTGYYDQAHLINEFQAIAGKAPRVFMNELLAAAVA